MKIWEPTREISLAESVIPEIIDFEFLCKDEVCAHIIANTKTGQVQYDVFTADWKKQPWNPEWCGIEDVWALFEERVVPRERVDIREILDFMHLDHYNPYQMCLQTHGRMTCDDLWIRFKGESLTWRDVHDSRPL